VSADKLGIGFDEAETTSKIKTKGKNKIIILAAVVFISLALVVVVRAIPNSETVPNVEYSTITVPSDQISVSYYTLHHGAAARRFRPFHPLSERRYWVGIRGAGVSFRLEASRSQYQELRELRQDMGSGGFSVLPQHARGERRHVMVELRYIPGASNRVTPHDVPYAGLLVGYTILFDYNTVTVPGNAVEVTYVRIPSMRRATGAPPYTYWLTHADDLSLEVSLSQYEELRELLGRGNVTIELHYRTQTGRLMEFVVLESGT